MKKPLSETEPLSLMISSRCQDTFPYQGKPQPLGVLRRALKEKFEGIRLGGQPVFKVWIHEDESNTSALVDNWEKCLATAADMDIVLMLYNGRAGWLGADNPVKDGVGICHAELAAAYNKAPVKVRGIQLLPLVKAEPDSPDAEFQNYVSDQGIPAAQVTSGEDALKRAEELAAAIVLSLAREGVGVNSTGHFYAGEALAWSRANFQTRREKMTAAVLRLLRQRGGGQAASPAPGVVALAIQGVKVGFVCDSIPGSMSTAAARELVGQPFLHDHLITEPWSAEIAGPVHVIACQKGISEAQAVRQLGFPDAVVVSAPFGVYVADDVQKIQMAFIAHCRDETTTREKAQSFLNWLNDHGEAEYLVERAQHRRQLSDFMHQLKTPPAAAPAPVTPASSRKRAR